jgi:hypothetical protein
MNFNQTPKDKKKKKDFSMESREKLIIINYIPQLFQLILSHMIYQILRFISD